MEEKEKELVGRIKGIAKTCEIFNEFFKDDDSKEIFKRYITFDRESLESVYNETIDELIVLLSKDIPYASDYFQDFFDENSLSLDSSVAEKIEEAVNEILKEIK